MTIEEQAIKDLVTKFTDLINNNGKVESVDERGTQKLAYPIKKKEEGYYVVINFEAKPDSIDELERLSIAITSKPSFCNSTTVWEPM